MEKMKAESSEETPLGDNRRDRGDASEILCYQGQDIVLDTVSHFIIIGKLDDVSNYFITLRDADVHDRRESPSMNEKYVLDAKKYGIRCNRKLVHIRLQEVVSISLLDDIIEY